MWMLDDVYFPGGEINVLRRDQSPTSQGLVGMHGAFVGEVPHVVYRRSGNNSGQTVSSFTAMTSRSHCATTHTHIPPCSADHSVPFHPPQQLQGQQQPLLS